MFFSPDILTRKGGKFAIVWLAATKASKVKKREFSTVDIVKSCYDIAKHLPKRGDKASGHHRRRFSLYLASQLMYGVVVVFREQLNFLMVDVRQLMDHLRLQPRIKNTNIDLLQPENIRSITMADPIAEHAMDPVFQATFGRMDIGSSWDSLPIMNFSDGEFFSVSSEHMARDEDMIRRHIVPEHEITLREDQLSEMPKFDVLEDNFIDPKPMEEAAGFTPTEIRTLLEEFGEGPKSPIPEENFLHIAQMTDATPAPASSSDDVYLSVIPPTPLRPTSPQTPEVTMGPEQRPRRKRRFENPPSFELNQLDLGTDESVIQHRTSARKTKLATDSVPQISKERMNQMLEDNATNMRRVQEVLVDPRRLEAAATDWMTSTGIHEKENVKVFLDSASNNNVKIYILHGVAT